MKSTGRPAGPVGLTLLAVTAVAGILLAAHGWAGRHSVLTPGALAGTRSSSAASVRPSPPARSASSSAPAATPGASSPSAAPDAGALLRSQSYARYSYRVWPGTVGPAARAALTGLSVNVHRQGSGIMVTTGVIGQPGSAPRFYQQGAQVYIVEASLSDDSGNSDYNLGDDGLVVTDAQGRILQ